MSSKYVWNLDHFPKLASLVNSPLLDKFIQEAEACYHTLPVNKALVRERKEWDDPNDFRHFLDKVENTHNCSWIVAQHNSDWMNFPLMYFDKVIEGRSQELCPTIVHFLKSLGGVRIAGLSMLKAGGCIPLHTDSTGLGNDALACHVGLTGYGELTIKDDVQVQKPKQIFIFNSEMPHSAFNNTDQDRIVLYIDFVFSRHILKPPQQVLYDQVLTLQQAKPNNDSIPRIMHFIWFQGRAHIPRNYVENMRSFMKVNPNWSYRVWDETTLRMECIKYSAACGRIWDMLPTMMMKIELGRYVILCNHGGASIDMDMICHKPLDMLPHIHDEHTVLLSSMNASASLCRFISLGMYSQLINNAFIACPPRHLFLEALISNILSNVSHRMYQVMYRVLPITISTVAMTGSIVLTNTFMQHSQAQDNMVKILDPDIVESNTVCERSIIVHEHHLTWTSWWEKQLRDMLSR